MGARGRRLMARAPPPPPRARIGGFSRPSGVGAAASQRCVRGAQAPYKAETLGRWVYGGSRLPEDTPALGKGE